MTHKPTVQERKPLRPPEPIARDPHVNELVQEIRCFDSAMLVTRDTQHRLRARPLSVTRCEADGTIWFMTRRDSEKVHEVADDSRVAVVFQGPGRFISVTGAAQRHDDPELVADHWRESFRPWFPEGKHDSAAMLISVKALAAEFWDIQGLNRVRYVAHGLSAALRGEQATDDAGTSYHRKIGDT